MNIGKTLRKERPRLIKLPYGNVVRLFWKTNELMKLNRKRSEISITYCIGIIIMYPLELLIMKSRLR